LLGFAISNGPIEKVGYLLSQWRQLEEVSQPYGLPLNEKPRFKLQPDPPVVISPVTPPVVTSSTPSPTSTSSRVPVETVGKEAEGEVTEEGAVENVEEKEENQVEKSDAQKQQPEEEEKEEEVEKEDKEEEEEVLQSEPEHKELPYITLLTEVPNVNELISHANFYDLVDSLLSNTSWHNNYHSLTNFTVPKDGNCSHSLVFLGKFEWSSSLSSSPPSFFSLPFSPLKRPLPDVLFHVFFLSYQVID
jgi:hypothetical protein